VSTARFIATGISVDRTCAGCGKPEPKHEIDLVPGAKVRVCEGRSHYYPSNACVAKARAKLRLCSGCGAANTTLGTICHECRRQIERGLAAVERAPVAWWAIVPTTLGPYLTEEHKGRSRNVHRGLAEKLVALLGTGRRTADYRSDVHVHQADRHVPHYKEGGDHDQVYIELTDAEGATLRALVKEIRRVMRLHYADGLHDGDDALGRLMRGDLSVRDFEAHREAIKKEYRPDEEDEAP